MIRPFLLLFLFFGTLMPTFSQKGFETVSPEAIGAAMTKSMEGMLELSKEELQRANQINQKYATAIAQLRWEAGPGQTDKEALRRFILDWEKAMTDVLPLGQERQFKRIEETLIRDLQLSGLFSQTALFATTLGLSADQAAEVEALFAEYLPQMVEIRRGGDPERIKDRRLRGLRSGQERELQDILTPGQWDKYQKVKEDLWRQYEERYP